MYFFIKLGLAHGRSQGGAKGAMGLGLKVELEDMTFPRVS